MGSSARSALAEVGYIVWPRRCPVCDDWVARRGEELHAECVAALTVAAIEGTVAPRPLNRGAPIAWLFEDEPAFFRVLHGIKYERRIHLMEPLVNGSVAPPAAWPAGCVLTPMPDDATRRRERGFSVTTTLAECLVARGWGERLGVDLVRRQRNAPAQAKMVDAKQRWSNAQGLFRAARLAEVPPATPLVLVDDQVTSGATMASALLVLGARGNPVLGLALGGAHQTPREVHLDTPVQRFLDS